MGNEQLESIRRSDDARRTQFGFVNNLILGLSVATLGFASSTIKEAGSGRWIGVSVFCSICLLVASSMLGIACSWNRLADARQTANNSRWPNEADTDMARNTGDKSWKILKAQLITFCFGFVVLAGAFAAAHFADFFH
jgi:hypothetical protein